MSFGLKYVESYDLVKITFFFIILSLTFIDATVASIQIKVGRIDLENGQKDL